MRLYDHQGKRYLDAIGLWWVSLFGHTSLRINAAIRDQLARLEHMMLAGFTHALVVELSFRLSKLMSNRLGHCFYSSEGASVVEIALKMSFHYWHNNGHPEKNRFVGLQNGYCGEALSALSVTDVALFTDAYTPLLRYNARAPKSDWRDTDGGEPPQDYAHCAASALKTYVAEHHAETAAALNAAMARSVRQKLKWNVSIPTQFTTVNIR